MRRLIKQVNFVYKGGKTAFQTFWDSTTKEKEYAIVDKNGVEHVSKDGGNSHFKYLRKKYPEGKVLTIVDVKDYACDIKWYHEFGHFVIDVNGKRYCSCDTIQEVREELEEIRKNFAEKGCQPHYNSV